MLDHRFSTSGPRAGSGPRDPSIRPARGFQAVILGAIGRKIGFNWAILAREDQKLGNPARGPKRLRTTVLDCGIYASYNLDIFCELFYAYLG